LSSPRSAAALMNRMPNGHEMLTPDTSPDATAPFRGPYEGEIWYNKNLAATFREVAANGKDGYYKGRIAKEIVKVLGDMGGVMTEEDLANHYVRYVLHAARCTLHAARCTLHAAARCTREGT
jgi:gamma-glutamyltranspeptidase/glutathione hydrolase